MTRIGACPWCNLEGIRCGKTTVYPSALALVNSRSAARGLWASYKPGLPVNESDSSDAEEEKVPASQSGKSFDAHVEATIKKGIKANTSAGALASGKKAAKIASKRLRKLEPFFGVSVYCELFQGHTYHACNAGIPQQVL